MDDHKTSKKFGAAQLFLWSEEFEWLKDWVGLRNTAKLRPGKNNRLVFFTFGKGPAKDLNSYLKSAWRDMGLPGLPTFTDVRTAVSAYTKTLHPPRVRKNMTDICHKTETADKFYALSLNPTQSRQLRQQFEYMTSDEGLKRLRDEKVKGTRRAKEDPEEGPPPPASIKRDSDSTSTTSESEEDVPYQESGSSGLEEELEELRVSNSTTVFLHGPCWGLCPSLTLSLYCSAEGTVWLGGGR